jgi:hypothetical protein
MSRDQSPATRSRRPAEKFEFGHVRDLILDEHATSLARSVLRDHGSIVHSAEGTTTLVMIRQSSDRLAIT